MVGIVGYAWYSQPSIHAPLMNAMFLGGALAIGATTWKAMEVDDAAE